MLLFHMFLSPFLVYHLKSSCLILVLFQFLIYCYINSSFILLNTSVGVIFSHAIYKFYYINPIRKRACPQVLSCVCFRHEQKRQEKKYVYIELEEISIANHFEPIMRVENYFQIISPWEINLETSPKLYRSYFPHRLRYSLSPVCGIFLGSSDFFNDWAWQHCKRQKGKRVIK